MAAHAEYDMREWTNSAGLKSWHGVDPKRNNSEFRSGNKCRKNPIEKNLKSERLNVGDIAEEMRGQGIESLDDVKWCVLESSGSMSFVKRSG